MRVELYIHYRFSYDRKFQHYRPVNKIVDEHGEHYFIVQIPPDVFLHDLICDKERGFEAYLKTQFDKSFFSRGYLDALQRLAIPGSVVTHRNLKILRWEDLSDKEQIEFLEGSFERYNDEVQAIIEKAVGVFKRKQQLDSGVPAAPVADAPADITSIRPYPQIFAQGDETASTFDNSGAAGMIVAGNSARAVDELADIKSLLVSINAKMPSKITRIEDIPPLDLGNPNWKTAKEYAEIKGLSVEALRSNRSSGDKSDDGKAGIHNGHAWRSVGEGSKTKVYYYLY